MNKLTDFGGGCIAGFIAAAVIFGVILGIVITHNKDKEIIQYAEKQIEIEALREDYVNRTPDEFLDEIPDVRRAADGAAADFDRKRDEILQRFRGRYAD